MCIIYKVYVVSVSQAIGTRLSELCHGESESPANILGYVYDEESKRRMKKEDEDEDFLDDSESISKHDPVCLGVRGIADYI